MRKLFILILLIAIKQFAFAQGSCGPGYVHLQGRQFIDDNGNNFYPMVMNYNIQILHEPLSTPPLYFVSPAIGYDGTDHCSGHTQAACSAQFQNDFAKIKLMGFNTIRTDLSAHINYDPATLNWVFSFGFLENVNPFWQQPNNPPVPTSMDFDQNFTNATDFFNIITAFLDEACTAGLKVIFVTGSMGRPVSASVRYTPVYNADASQGYSEYLTKLASITATHKALLAYDLWNEPIYNGLNLGLLHPNGELLKQDICNYEKNWYDAIRVNDQNHLITMGGSNIDEMFHWDMGLLKLDFYSMHIYPSANNFMKSTDMQTAITDGMNTFPIICYWMSKVCSMPWIIGETSFAADDNTSPPPLDPANVPVHLPPYMFGSEAQQDQFAQLSLAATRNSLGSGYSWWAFQNVSWWSNTSGYGNYPDKMPDDFVGLLHYGDGTLPWTDKPAVATFAAYLHPTTHQPPGIIPLTAPPANYYNPNHIYDPAVSTSLNPTGMGAVTGFVYDDKGNPIKDAVVYGTSWLWTDDPDNDPTTLPNYYYHDSPFSFTHDDGSFLIAPYNYYQPMANHPHRIVALRISAVGAERKDEGAGWPYGETQMANNIGTESLKKVTTGYDAVASNETVNGTENYYGWNSLSVNDITINGSSNLTAQNEINVHTEFHASNGSEVHIYTSSPSNTYPDCGDFSSFLRTINPSLTNQTNNANADKEIELQFADSKQLNAVIYPNPNSGSFTISIQNPLKDEAIITLENLMGEMLWVNKTAESEISSNFNFLAKGVYLIHIKNSEQAVTKKLIIN